jgi:hypothetical protein
VLDEINWY